MTTTFRRRISPIERMYFPMKDMAPPFLMQLEIRGDGAIDVGRLRSAVRIAADACPGARLTRDGDYWVDSGVPPAVREISGHTLNDARLEEDPVLTSPIERAPEATCEVILLTAAPATIIFRAFHGVMDGVGLVLWANNVFRALRGQNPHILADPISDDELVRELGPVGKPAVLIPRFRSAIGYGRQSRHQARHLLRHRSINAAGTGALARVASVLAAEAGSTQRFMVPVDLRRHALELSSTANLALPLFLDVAPGQSWVQINADKRAGLAERRELDQIGHGSIASAPDSLARTILRATNWLGARYGRNLVSATISHLGRFDLEKLRAPGFTPTSVRALPQHSVAMPLLFAMTEVDGRTELTVSARNGLGIESRLEALLDRITATLEAPVPQRDSSSV
ncbi:peptide synthetase [Nocardia sp. NPDC006044]|uniref:peptide synthetase n=1 Tax=Nocardia sp. NPDC006044 TaxID=3364306 RepID=UPI0036C58D99